MARPKQTAPKLPLLLLKEPPTIKLLYLYLLDKGEVNYSQRALAEALGIEQVAVKNALKRLRALKLIEDRGEVKPRILPRFKAIKPD